MAKSVFVEALRVRLAHALQEYKDNHPPEERIRLCLALHVGEIYRDNHGVAGYRVASR